jgi:hypothetical protein
VESEETVDDDRSVARLPVGADDWTMKHARLPSLDGMISPDDIVWLMGYRDDREAAYSRAQAAERRLSEALEQKAQDAEQLTALRSELAAAKRQLAQLRLRGIVADPKCWAVVAIAAIGAVFFLRGGVSPDPFPRRVNMPYSVEGGFHEALSIAKHRFPDATLAALRATYVDWRGRSDGYVQYDFVSPSRANGSGRREPHCAVGVSIADGYLSVGLPWTAACSDPPLVLRCRVEDVLRRFNVTQGKKAHLHVSARREGWLVDPENAPASAPPTVIPDDCGKP